jgi:beta-lactamase class C
LRLFQRISDRFAEFVIIFLLAFSSFAALSSDSDTVPAWFESYQSDVSNRAKTLNIPGFAMLYYQQGMEEPVFVVQGNVERGGKAIDEDTVFRMASVSKTFTGVLMAKLVEQNSVTWNTQLVELVDQPTFKSEFTDALVLEHLIGQSSGYMPNAYDNLIEADYPVKRVLRQLADLEPLCQPGKCYTYQNALFGTLENYFSSQNTSYHRQLQTQLFDPLNMETASAGKGALIASSKWAQPHIAIAKNRWRKGLVESNYYRFSPAAGVNASIRDIAIWLRAMLGEYPEIVTPSLINEVSQPRVKTKREIYRRGWREHLDDAHYGLGWRIYDFEGNKLVYHGGWVKGYRADVSFSPDTGAAFAMLINAESNLINYTTAEFWHSYFEAYQTQQQTAQSSEVLR